MPTSRSLWSWIAVVTVVSLADLGQATPLDPALLCRIARYKAAARYIECEEGAFARDVNPGTLILGGVSFPYNTLAGKCRLKYQTAFSKMAAAGGAPLCSGPRFVDTGSGTIVDKLTALEWEQKTDDGTIHDKDNTYSWSASGSAADGTAFTTFLATLNGGACFAGHCDWRLPTVAELQTILEGSSPCTTCLDAVFLPAQTFPHWTASEDPDLTDLARQVSFTPGVPANVNNGIKTAAGPVRGVRGGL